MAAAARAKHELIIERWHRVDTAIYWHIVPTLDYHAQNVTVLLNSLVNGNRAHGRALILMVMRHGGIDAKMTQGQVRQRNVLLCGDGNTDCNITSNQQAEPQPHHPSTVELQYSNSEALSANIHDAGKPMTDETEDDWEEVVLVVTVGAYRLLHCHTAQFDALEGWRARQACDSIAAH